MGDGFTGFVGGVAPGVCLPGGDHEGLLGGGRGSLAGHVKGFEGAARGAGVVGEGAANVPSRMTRGRWDWTEGLI